MRSPVTQTSALERRRGWRAALSDSDIRAIAAYALVAAGAAVAAHFLAFSLLQSYDDEGTLLVTLKAFSEGETLYRDIYIPYGPFYYEVFGGLFALTDQAVTTNASRSIVVVIWVATSLLYGISAQRLTGRLMLGVTGMLTAFVPLNVLVNEPMHPQMLCVLLLGLLTLLATFEPSRRGIWLGGGVGALVAALLLTKVNLGVYALVAVVLAGTLTFPPLWSRRWLRWLVIAGALMLPAVIVARDLGFDWVRDFLALEVLSMAAIIVAAWPLSSRSRNYDGMGRWLVGSMIGFGVAFIAIMGAIMLNGSSPADVYGGVITEAMRVRDVLILPFPSTPSAVNWAIAAVAFAAVVTYLGPSIGGTPSIWPGLLRGIAGLVIWFSLTSFAPVGINPSPGNPASLAMVLAWVAVIPPAGARESSHKRFLRVLLPALAVAETLQVYPVAGSQQSIAALSFVPVGALCLADALTSLRAWSDARGPLALERFRVVALVVTVALAVEFGLHAVVRPAANAVVRYRDQTPLPFPGAGQVRIPAADADTYIRLVGLLHHHRCTSFIGYPNINSLYIWSGIDAPPPIAPGGWINALSSETQQRIVDELRASPRPCAIRSDSRAELWLHGTPPFRRPLVNYVFNEFQTVDEVAEFQFMLPIKGDSLQRDSR